MSSSSESQGFVGAESDGLQGRSRMRKGGKSKGKKDTLPYLAQLNSSYQKIDFIENLGKAFEDKLDFEQGEIIIFLKNVLNVSLLGICQRYSSCKRGGVSVRFDITKLQME